MTRCSHPIWHTNLILLTCTCTHMHTRTHTHTHTRHAHTHTRTHTHTLSTSSSRVLFALSTFSLACSLAADSSCCRELSSAMCCWAWSDFCFNSFSRNRTWSGDNGHHTHHSGCCILLNIHMYVCTQMYPVWVSEACAVNHSITPTDSHSLNAQYTV